MPRHELKHKFQVNFYYLQQSADEEVKMYKLNQFSYSFYRFSPSDSNKDKCSIIIEIYYSLENYFSPYI